MASVWGSVEEAFDLVVQSLDAHTETFKSMRAEDRDQQDSINQLADIWSDWRSELKHWRRSEHASNVLWNGEKVTE